jgi:hypothetical protein
MLQLLTIIFDREDNHEELRNIAQQSPMLQMTTFKQQLESYWRKTSDNQSDENKQRKQRRKRSTYILKRNRCITEP